MIRTYRSVLASALVIVGSGLALAQDAPVPGMPAKMALTIPEAIELAWRNNIASIRQTNELDRSRAEKLRSRSTWMPSLDLDLGWTNRFGPSFFQGVIVGQNEQRDEWGYTFRLRQPIFNGFSGSYLHSPRANAARVNSSEEDLRATRQSLALDTKAKCYDLLKAQKLADVQDRAVQRSIEQLETSKARYELGSASMSDFLKAKVQLGNDSLTLITRQNAIEIARAELNSFLALDVSRATEIDVELDYAPYPLPSAGAIEQALANHPIVQAREYDMKRWAYELGGTQFTRLPSINFNASYGWVGTEFPSDLGNVTESDTYSYGVSLSWSIFSGFSTSANVKQAKVSKHAAESELAQARRDVLLDIKVATLGVTEAGQRFRVAEDQVESAQEDLDIAQEKYNLGAATILDILVAQVNLSSAETDRIQAGYDWLLSIAELERAMGGGD